jgi:ABC-2 type transport system ATP-binding protein
MTDPILDIQGLCKTYASKSGGGGTAALDNVDLQIRQGEIFALLGPNGAGKTTLIGAVCGLVRPTGGTIRAFGLDMKRDWRKARAKIGLVPQELSVDMFEHVLLSVNHSRGLFGFAPDPQKVEDILRALSLWDKRHSRISELSGGMKRRVLIAKALAHEPELLFLDEPTAGVDVELRRDMWRMIGELRTRGVTIILTTHYIEEAEEMADRVGVINQGKLVLVDEKHALMSRLGRTEAQVGLVAPMTRVPTALEGLGVQLVADGNSLVYRTDGDSGQGHGVADLVKALVSANIEFKSFDVHQSSLEDIFVDLVERKPA